MGTELLRKPKLQRLRVCLLRLQLGPELTTGRHH
jgi:hypothetical protein